MQYNPKNYILVSQLHTIYTHSNTHTHIQYFQSLPDKKTNLFGTINANRKVRLKIRIIRISM